MAALFISIPVVGAADLVTGADLGFSPLYAAPVALLAWRHGRRAGLAAACFGGAAWSAAGHLNRPDLPIAAGVWNDAIRIGGLVVLALLLAVIRRSQDDLRAALDQRDEFLSVVAHELRGPVAAIEIVATRLARSAGPAGEQQLAIEQLLEESRDLRGLAEDVLSIGRFEAGVEHVEQETFDVRDLLWELAGRSDRINVLDAPLGALNVRADRQQTRRALANVLDNALKFSGENDPVRVSVREDDGFARIEITDNGIGLTAEEAGQLFVKYARIDDAFVARKPGVGLGLYLTRLMLSANGGSIEAISPGKGQGSTFVLQVPLDREPGRSTAVSEGHARA